MQIKINGEQPFQVLSTNFTIGPSESGYDLYFSADGINGYSKLFTVSANTNRQVTSVAAGSYYILSGNTDEVTVNWIKECGNGGGGGGSYVLPVASESTLGGVKIGSGITIDENGAISAEGGGSYVLPVATDSTLGGIKVGSGLSIDSNGVLSASGETYTLPAATDSTLGGIKVGSGLTIDNQGVLSVSGGSSDSNYVIVDALSAITNPVEGMMAQVRTSSGSSTYYRLYVSDPGQAPTSEGYWGVLHCESLGDRAIYLADSGTKFYWDWEDNRYPDWAAGEWDGRSYEYRCDFSGSYPEFHIKFPAGSDVVLWNAYYDEGQGDYVTVGGISSGTSAETIYNYSSPYIYQKDTWIPVYKTYVKSDIKSFSTSAQTAEFVDEVLAMIRAGRAPFVFDDEHNKMMVLDSYGNDYVTYICNREGTDRYISCSSTKHEQDEYNAIGIKTWENNWVPSPEYITAYFRVNTAGTIYDCDGREYYVSFDNEFPRILLLYQGGEGYPPQSEAYVEWRTSYKALNGDNEEKWYYVFGGKVGIGTTIYNGVWGCLQDDWTIETLSWTSGATYTSQTYPPYNP